MKDLVDKLRAAQTREEEMRARSEALTDSLAATEQELSNFKRHEGSDAEVC